MRKIPTPIFHPKLPQISWKKIYAREYGVQYSEMAILCLSDRAKYHIPAPSTDQIVIPEGNNTAFYIDDDSWVKLVASLKNRYVSHQERLEEYEKQFTQDGRSYLAVSKRIASHNLRRLSNKELSLIYKNYQEKLFKYSVFAWTSFILNNFVAERATSILDRYLEIHKREEEKQEVYESLFHPTKRAAVLKLQYQVSKHGGKLTSDKLNNLYDRFRWLSCLDIHNKPWTREEFKNHLQSFKKTPEKKTVSFNKIADELEIKQKDQNYLSMAQRFVFIKDARDDYRRQGVYFSASLFKELARRIGIKKGETSYLQEKEVIAFLEGNIPIDQKVILERKREFVLYLDTHRNLICLTGDDIANALDDFELGAKEAEVKEIKGTVASKGKARGIVTIVRGVKDLSRVSHGDILVAASTHPDYVPAMRKAAAIVTDEGGITSHAAIVSREFGIPCIVGTNNVTKILHDGDVVELDSMRGTVRIIKHKA